MGASPSSCGGKDDVEEETPAIDGWLGKRGILLGSYTMKQRYVILDGTLRLLDIYEKPGGEYLGCIDLNGSVAVQYNRGVKNGFDIVSPARVFEFVAANQQQQAEWVRTLQKVTLTTHVLFNPIEKSGKSTSGRISLDDLVLRCRTGDVILFYDKDPGAKFIHTFTASKWNHVGMVIKPSPNRAYIIEWAGGIYVGDLRKRLAAYFAHGSFLLSWRQLQLPSERIDRNELESRLEEFAVRLQVGERPDPSRRAPP